MNTRLLITGLFLGTVAATWAQRDALANDASKDGAEMHAVQQQTTPEPAQEAAPQHREHDKKKQQPEEKSASEHSGHSTKPGASHEGHASQTSHTMMSTVTGGPFRSMHAMGSGTALQPASSPMHAWHFMRGAWMIMLHGELKTGLNHQGGPRGITKAESQNWLMLMGERTAGPGRLLLRGMFSGEPLTTPHGGFPQLFQTGETYRGRAIVDAQHAHDLIMELAASYTIPFTDRTSLQFYGGPVGEPALGPVAFMHRVSAADNPAAPLAHHWHDSTHITHGVVTAGITMGLFKLESSVFRGAEPDENRVTVDFGKLDSYSFRAGFTPAPNWASQISFGHLKNPEAIQKGDLNRLTASIAHNLPLTEGNWASTLAWGRNSEEHGVSNAYLLESSLNFLKANYVYTRLELGDRSGLLAENIFGRRGLVPLPRIPEHDNDHHLPEEFERSFRVGAFTFGAVRDLWINDAFRMGLGADFTFYHKPSALDVLYGRHPTSFRVFVRFRPGAMK